MSKSAISYAFCLLLLMAATALAGEAKIKSFSIDLPQGFEGPKTKSSGPVEIIAFVKPHKGQKTSSLM